MKTNLTYRLGERLYLRPNIPGKPKEVIIDSDPQEEYLVALRDDSGNKHFVHRSKLNKFYRKEGFQLHLFAKIKSSMDILKSKHIKL